MSTTLPVVKITLPRLAGDVYAEIISAGYVIPLSIFVLVYKLPFSIASAASSS
jgi:hypothetical protein